jgi:hypothetical protein
VTFLGELGNSILKGTAVGTTSGYLTGPFRPDGASSLLASFNQGSNRGVFIVDGLRGSGYVDFGSWLLQRGGRAIELLLIEQKIGGSFKRNGEALLNPKGRVRPNLMIVDQIEERVLRVEPRADEMTLLSGGTNMMDRGSKKPGLATNRKNRGKATPEESFPSPPLVRSIWMTKTLGRQMTSLRTTAIAPPHLGQSSSTSPWQAKAGSRESVRQLAEAERLKEIASGMVLCSLHPKHSRRREVEMREEA